MSRFLVSWTYRLPEKDLPAPFEYVVHPTASETGAHYCTAIVEAASWKSAWAQITNSFPNAVRQVVEPATKPIEDSFGVAKKMAGVRIIPAKKVDGGQ